MEPDVQRVKAPQCGWYAVSVNCLHDRSGSLDYFCQFVPDARVGYSILIYKLSLEEVNRVRGDRGLVQLDDCGPRATEIQNE